MLHPWVRTRVDRHAIEDSEGDSVTDELIRLDFDNLPVRWVLVDGEPWFIAADVAVILGYRMASDATRRLDEDEKGTHSVRTPGGEQDVIVVNEPGLYSLVLGSKLPDAKRFKRWVTHDVLPSIRKTGGFGNRELSRLELIDLARDAEVGRLAAEEQLAIAAPKADYVDSFVNGDTDATTIRVFANQLQLGEKELRAQLVAAKAIYQKLEGRRYSRSKGRMVPEYSWHSYATHRAWFVERDQPEAPRYHNGQVRTTLYVTPVGKVKIASLVTREGEAS